jgi:NADPH2:quinone reductase
MNHLMKAICLVPNEGVKLQNVEKPQKAEAGHLIVQMDSFAINPGDKAFISRPLPLGAVASLYNIYGVSGAGTVLETGPGVPERYTGKKVALYRSLKSSENIIGTWCEYSQVHFLDCVILPDDAKLDEYSGSLVNTITPYAFLNQITEEGHKGIISTAGTSATGIAMAGICSAHDFPLISIVRNEDGKKKLESLGAKNVIAQNDADFQIRLKETAHKLEATAVFDGVGGETLNKIIDILPNYSTIFTYGYLGGNSLLAFHTSLLNAKVLTIKSFGNFRTKTVQDPQRLEKALGDIGAMIHMPHFKTPVGKKFKLEEINDALLFTSGSAKAVLYPFE